MPRIFISYRRDDSGYVADILADRIRATFGPDSVFMDVDAIPLGVDFREHINNALAQCDILLAIIGENWAAKSADGSKRRIDEPTDFVRMELETALARNIPVIPVLAGKATMPSAHDLPATLEPLSFRNATELRSGRELDHHVETLIRGLRVHMAPDERSSKTAAKSLPKKAAKSQLTTAAKNQPKTPATSKPKTAAKSKPKDAFKKEWTASYEGNRIRVTNWWTFSGEGEAKLFINNTCVDSSTELSAVSLHGTVKGPDGADHIVKVFFGGLLTVKVKISVDGVQIGGDSF